MINVTCLSCFICCPTMVINSETRGRVANSSTQSDSDPVATASLVFAENQFNRMQTVEGPANQGSSALTQSDQVAVATNVIEVQSKQTQTVEGQYNQESSASTQSDPVALDQVNQMQTVGGPANQGLSNQGSRETEVSKFVNKVELNRSNSPIPRDDINLRSQGFHPFNSTDYYTLRDERNDNINEENKSEYSGRQSPPPPPPPRNLPVANDSLSNEDARFFLPVRLSDDNSEPSNNIGNPKEEQPESPPPPPSPPLRQNATNNQSQILSVTVMEAIAREAEEVFPNIESNQVYSQPFQESSLKEPQKTEPPVFTGINFSKFPGKEFESSPSPEIKPIHSQASVENFIWV